MSEKFDMSYLGVMVDMAGCPNRCRHCWLGSHKNGNMTVNDFRSIADQLKTGVTKTAKVSVNSAFLVGGASRISASITVNFGSLNRSYPHPDERNALNYCQYGDWRGTKATRNGRLRSNPKYAKSHFSVWRIIPIGGFAGKERSGITS